VRLPAFLTSLVLALGWLALATPTAQAATADTFDRFDVQAILDSDGYLTVTETIVLRFGSDSGRHGLERTLRTREPDGADNDMVFKIDQITASSPSGDSSKLALTDQGVGTRDSSVRIRVGDANTTVPADTATYVLSYRVLGLVRNANGVDQLYWDVTGSAMPFISTASVNVTVPGGAQELSCSAATSGRAGSCADSQIDADGAAQFAADGLNVGGVMTVAVRLKSGLVKTHSAILEQRADQVTAEQRLANGWRWGIPIAVLALLLPLAGLGYARRKTRDLRFVDLPPGVLPAPGQRNRVATSSRLSIPVAFAPPKLALAEAGLLMDGKVEVRDTTATLVGLAVSGAIRLSRGDALQAQLVDRDAAVDEPSRLLLSALFGESGKDSNSVMPIEPSAMRDGHSWVVSSAETRSEKEGWYKRTPGEFSISAPRWLTRGGLVLGGIVLAYWALIYTGFVGLGAYLLLVASMIGTWLVVRKRISRGQRSAVGRALTDQVEGFRTYLATAEADQLRFEAGEDIFSKYLPWAVMFGLADRWTQLCSQLAAADLPAPASAWYVGGWDLALFSQDLDYLDREVSVDYANSAASGSGFFGDDAGWGSGGSAFGGSGAYSGGGGGGGGGGSW
jgi:hypothetical protein